MAPERVAARPAPRLKFGARSPAQARETRNGALPPGSAPPRPAGWLAFDMDGVLVDVRGSFRIATEHTVEALGGTAVRSGEIAHLKHAGGFNNDWDVTRELLLQRGIAVPRARVIAVFNDFYLGRNGRRGLILEERWLLPRETLRRLRRRYRLAIFTGRPRADALFTLRRFRVEAAFDALLGLEDTKPKPHPDGLRQLRRRHAGLPITAYFGDTVDDARCAASARVPFVGIADRRSAHGRELAKLFAAAGSQRLAASVAAAVGPFLNGGAPGR